MIDDIMKMDDDYHIWLRQSLASFLFHCNMNEELIYACAVMNNTRRRCRTLPYVLVSPVIDGCPDHSIPCS
jgi:hypothetical protein